MRAIQLGFACNNACVFCAQGDLRSTRPERPDALALIAAVGPGDVVALVGGEPTLRPDLPALVAAAEARGAARIIVQTNGRRLAYRSYAVELRAASARLVLDVSLHGSTPAMHDYHTSSPGSFAQTALGLRHARAVRLPFGVSTVVTRSNFRHLAEITRLAHASGTVAVRFALAEPSGNAARDRPRVVPAIELARPHLEQAVIEAARLGITDREGLFAGLGEVEPAREAPRKVALPVLGRDPK